MTNADKFLKEGVDIAQLAREITELSWSNDDCLEDNIALYFSQQVEPTLTEDERVILKNIGEDCISLIRQDGEIYFNTEGHGLFPNLFKFIKEGEEYTIKEMLGDEK